MAVQQSGLDFLAMAVSYAGWGESMSTGQSSWQKLGRDDSAPRRRWAAWPGISLALLAIAMSAITSWRPRADGPLAEGWSIPIDEARDGLEAELATLAATTGTRPVRQSLGESRRRHGRGWALRRALLVADLAGCAVALLVVQFTVVGYHAHDARIDVLLLLGLVAWAVLAKLFGLYELNSVWGASAADDFPAILLLSTLATWLGLVTLSVTGISHPRVSVASIFWLLSIVLVTTFRIAARAVVQRTATAREPTLVIGNSAVASRISRKLAVHPDYGLDVVGFLDDVQSEPDGGPAYQGPTSRLEYVLRALQIEHVIIASSDMSIDQQVDLSRRCMDLGAQVDIVPRMFEVIGSKNRVHDLDGIPVVEIRPARLSPSSRRLKRTLDLVVAGLSLVVLAPFMLYAAWRIKRESPGPVFFRQERMGTGGRRFEILKFRTMFEDAEQRKADLAHMNHHTEAGPRMFKIHDDPRVTPFGRFLRRWSLDELPQLVNVVRGEMSLVGPRPLILDEDEHIVGLHRGRLNLLPGITGLWQVLGRSDVPFSEMVALDHLYVTNWSLWGDVKLLLGTIPVVLSRRGAY